MWLSFRYTIGKLAVGRATSLSLVLDTFSVHSCRFLFVLVLVIASLNSKYPPPDLFLSLFLNSHFKSIAAISSLPLLSGCLGTQTFRFKLLSNLNRRLPGSVNSCCFSNNRRVLGAFVSFVNDVHNRLVGSPVVVSVSKFLFHFQVCKIKLVIFVDETVRAI